MSTTGRSAGDAGEEFVAGRLRREGYEIVARNWRVRGGEVDIIARDGDTLVLVEVRVRTGERIVASEETVDRRKLQRIMRAGEAFIAAHPTFLDMVWRVDFVAITLRRDGVILRYNHFRNLTLE